MRISTSTLYDANVAALNQQQGKMFKTQQLIGSGRRMLTPADDPAAAAQALDVQQSDSANTQYGNNIDGSKNALSLSESVLQSITTLLQDVHTTAVNAGNGTLSNSDRQSLAADMQQRLDELLVYANHTDATGNFLFSGFQGSTPPFANGPAGVQYMGDDGKHMVQVNSARQVAINDSGADIFMRIKNGNGTFVTQEAVTNTGSGIASVGNVIDPAALTGDTYQVTFTSATTFDITDTTTATVVSAGNAYVSGQPIQFGGMQFDIHGAPANGDQFTVAPSTNESVFKTISDFISALNTPVITGNAASSAQLTANIGRALNGVDRDLNNVLTVRASIGSRLRALDAEKSSVDDLNIQYKSVLSQLQDLDYNKAITDLTQQQTTLQAAQKSFNLVSGLSLFNYM